MDKYRTLIKSNEMISAKHKSSLLELKVTAISLTRVHPYDGKSTDNYHNGQLCAELYPSDLVKLLSDKKHIYRDLKEMATKITGHSMILEDGKGNFIAFSAIPFAEYKGGVFRVFFADTLKGHVLHVLNRGFTPLSLSTMISFDNSSSFRIYELLRKDLYRSKKNINDGEVVVNYNLFEFRFIIGIANSDNDFVKRYLNKFNDPYNIDWEHAYNELIRSGIARDSRYKDVYRLQKDCLDVAKEEIREKSDIRFEYEMIRVGRTYKEIVFHIFPNTPSVVIENTRQIDINLPREEEYYQYDVFDFASDDSNLYRDFVGHNRLLKEDIDILIKEADMDPDLVRKAIEYADNQPMVIDNYVGYLIDCIRKRYFDKIGINRGSAESYDRFQEILPELEKTGSIVHLAALICSGELSFSDVDRDEREELCEFILKRKEEKEKYKIPDKVIEELEAWNESSYGEHEDASDIFGLETREQSGRERLLLSIKQKPDFADFLVFEKQHYGILPEEYNLFSTEDAISEYKNWVAAGRPTS